MIKPPSGPEILPPQTGLAATAERLAALSPAQQRLVAEAIANNHLENLPAIQQAMHAAVAQAPEGVAGPVKHVMHPFAKLLADNGFVKPDMMPLAAAKVEAPHAEKAAPQTQFAKTDTTTRTV